MIGKVIPGKSFYSCIRYCLEDNNRLSEQEKIARSLKDGLQHKGRAEILAFNKCGGDIRELAEQLEDVARLSTRVEKPLFHFVISLAPGEALTKEQWVEIGEAVAKEFQVEDHQYMAVLHKDSDKQHIHVVANRVGYDGKAATTSNSYLRMAQLCRKLEKQYQVQEVLSPKRFLPKEQRNLPRNDRRKEKIKNDIRQSLEKSGTYSEFEQKMQKLGYQIIKGRGISFTDDKKVTVKGSEVGFSLATIEKILRVKNDLKIKPGLEKVVSRGRELLVGKNAVPEQVPAQPLPSPSQNRKTATQKMILQRVQNNQTERPIGEQIIKGGAALLYELMKPEYVEEGISQELLKEANKKKKKRRRPNW